MTLLALSSMSRDKVDNLLNHDHRIMILKRGTVHDAIWTLKNILLLITNKRSIRSDVLLVHPLKSTPLRSAEQLRSYYIIACPFMIEIAIRSRHCVM